MYFVILIASIVGSMADPVFWVFIAIAAAIPFLGRNWPIYTLLAALVAVLVRIGIAGSNRHSRGIPIDNTIIWTGLSVFTAMILVSLVVFLVRRVLSRSASQKGNAA